MSCLAREERWHESSGTRGRVSFVSGPLPKLDSYIHRGKRQFLARRRNIWRLETNLSNILTKCAAKISRYAREFPSCAFSHLDKTAQRLPRQKVSSCAEACPFE